MMRHHRHGGRQQSWRCPQRHPALGNCCCVPILSPWSFIYRSTRCSAWPTANGWCHRRGQGGCHGSWPSIREFCYVGHRYAGGEFSVSGSGGLGSERCPAVSVCVAQFGQFVFCRSRASTAALIPDAFPVVSFACSARVQRSVGVRELFLGPGGGLFREVARSPQSAATRVTRFCRPLMLWPWWAHQPVPRRARRGPPALWPGRRCLWLGYAMRQANDP
jgi:hypothetical protein